MQSLILPCSALHDLIAFSTAVSSDMLVSRCRTVLALMPYRDNTQQMFNQLLYYWFKHQINVRISLIVKNVWENIVG